MSFSTRLVIATRESRLALWQAHFLRDRLLTLYPDTPIEVLGMTTTGDQILDRTLAKVGGKGLFVKELESALLEKRANLAIHSAKDVPMELAPEFELLFMGPREAPYDAFVSAKYRSLDELPQGAIVGTSSLRRQSQILARHPHLRVQTLRGNLDTRLRKLDEGHYDAILLAAAGLIRLGKADRIASTLSLEDSIPAVGQGALALEYRSDDDTTRQLIQALEDPPVAQRVRAERAFSRRLAGSCDVPLGAHAVFQGTELKLSGFVASPDGKTILQDQLTGSANAPEDLGQALAERLLHRGAAALLASRHDA
jgi:hydroxymethylbilane synthase